MLILNPQRVEFGAAVLDRITSIAIDRTTPSPLEQWGSAGPWCALVDSTRRRIAITLRQEPGPVLDGGPALGSQSELRIAVSPTLSSRLRRRIRCTCVVTGVRYDQPAGRAATRIIDLLAVSVSGSTPAGAADPVVIEEVAP